MIANTGTYLDSPFHRYADGADLAGIELELAGRAPRDRRPPAVRSRAWRSTRREFEGTRRRREGGAGPHRLGPPLADRGLFHRPSVPDRKAAQWLVNRGARLVGSTATISTTRAQWAGRSTALLAAGILICEHMTSLGALPDEGFAFTAVPPKIEGMGTFPVRAFALLE